VVTPNRQDQRTQIRTN